MSLAGAVVEQKIKRLPSFPTLNVTYLTKLIKNVRPRVTDKVFTLMEQFSSRERNKASYEEQEANRLPENFEYYSFFFFNACILRHYLSKPLTSLSCSLNAVIPCLKMREHLRLRYCNLRTCPRRRVTEKSHLFHFKRRSGRDYGEYDSFTHPVVVDLSLVGAARRVRLVCLDLNVVNVVAPVRRLP
jgi:hypothetical protein